MSQIKYIFRDFWWTVAKINIKKDGYVAQLERMYNLPRSILFEYLSAPMDKFRRWEISEKETRETFSKNIGLPMNKNISILFHTSLDDYSTLYQSIIAFVKKLQKNRYKCIILSDDFVPQTKKNYKAWRYKSFDDLLISCEIWLSKHDDRINGTTKIFSYALKKYNIKPWEAILVDDVEKNCKIAKKIWIKTVVATSPRQTIRDVKKLLKIK